MQNLDEPTLNDVSQFILRFSASDEQVADFLTRKLSVIEAKSLARNVCKQAMTEPGGPKLVGPNTLRLRLAGSWSIRRLKSRRHTEPPVA